MHLTENMRIGPWVFFRDEKCYLKKRADKLQGKVK